MPQLDLLFFLPDNRSLLCIEGHIPLSFPPDHLHETTAPNRHQSYRKTLGCPNDLSLFGVSEHKEFLRGAEGGKKNHVSKQL